MNGIHSSSLRENGEIGRHKGLLEFNLLWTEKLGQM